MGAKGDNTALCSDLDIGHWDSHGNFVREYPSIYYSANPIYKDSSEYRKGYEDGYRDCLEGKQKEDRKW